ncbi:MAG: hypothetical protein KatS3mg068_0467 [Candidatus Sericytochromatia bacterium]|nr:MAG: hypothetical protein KatS3mg068_0467 [Candidatus Sericytochromatia bacterium]
MNKVLNMKEEYKIFFVAGSIFLATIIANFVVIYYSFKTYDGLVEENYYLKALNYQDNKNQIHAQKNLNWNVDIKKIDKEIEILLKDRNSKEIEKAKIEVTFFRPTQSGFDKKINLIERKKGIYVNSNTINLNKGIWDVYIKIRKDNLKWIKKQRIFIN